MIEIELTEDEADFLILAMEESYLQDDFEQKNRIELAESIQLKTIDAQNIGNS